MPDCFCVPDAGAKCSSARAVTGASTTAGRDAGISTRGAAGTVMPSARGATGAGAAKARARTK